jgi:RNA polymerase sigma-70 factor (ECF subfamily)
MGGSSLQDELRVSRLGERLLAGDPTVETLVVRQFTIQLVSLARRRLTRRICQKSGPEEVVQSAFRSFFRRLRLGQFELESWDSLWSLLAVITIRKCSARRDHYFAARRDVRREFSMSSPDTLCIPTARAPLPEEALALEELIEQVVQGLSESEQAIVFARLEGYTVEEISWRCKRSARTVRRILGRVRHRALRLMRDPDEVSSAREELPAEFNP